MGAKTGRKPDASGWASKANTRCKDGRTIKSDAFAHQDGHEVPLVYMHDHEDITNVLGHAVLTNKPEGLWADLFFNDTPNGQHAKKAVIHKDIRAMSIWANELVERAKEVFHGAVKEVSLVLGGANPGALIQSVIMEHGDGTEETLNDQAIIFMGLNIEHVDSDAGESLSHEDGGDGGDAGASEKTAQDIYDTLDGDQKLLLHWMLGESAGAKSGTETGSSAEHNDKGGKALQHNDAGDGNQEGAPVGGKKVIKHNVFEKGGDGGEAVGGELMHSIPMDDVKGILAHAAKVKNLDVAIQSWIDKNADKLEHGVENLDILMPQARALTTMPTPDDRRREWVAKVLSGVNYVPFAALKSWSVDLTFEQARARGYITGNFKKEQFIAVAQRETRPTTFYVKQKFDRDTVLDFTNFDLIMWVKGIMRIALEEEFARAILLGDGREADDEDKINETKIRPIATDDPFYTVTVTVDSDDPLDLVDTMILEREQYKGTGQPTFFTTQRWLSRALTRRNNDDVKLWKNKQELAADMDVADIVPVEIMGLPEYAHIVGVMVNLRDYAVGTDKGGETTLFDDFDIDFNLYKYLYEGRSSGALMDPWTAQVFVQEVGDAVTATAPTQDPETFVVTIPDVANVTYKDGEGNVLADGPVTLEAGDVLTVTAWAADGYHLANGRRRWTFMFPNVRPEPWES